MAVPLCIYNPAFYQQERLQWSLKAVDDKEDFKSVIFTDETTVENDVLSWKNPCFSKILGYIEENI